MARTDAFKTLTIPLKQPSKSKNSHDSAWRLRASASSGSSSCVFAILLGGDLIKGLDATAGL